MDGSVLEGLALAAGDAMAIKWATLEDCDRATGTVVVVDVIRAFTTAAYAFAAGARDIVLVGTVADAFALRKCAPGVLLMGEVGGVPVKGFDFSNSPAALADTDLAGRRLVQRTSQGTQGAVRSTRAEMLLAASFVCASATARYIRRNSPSSVTFVVTGARPDEMGDEDAACADYVAALLRGERADPTSFLQRVVDSRAGQRLVDPTRPEYPAADLAYCLAVNRFDFAMWIQRRDGFLVMEAVT